MPNLPWDTIDIIVLVAICYSAVVALIVLIAGRAFVPHRFKVRPAVIAAAQRGLHQRDQRHDAE